MSFKTIANGKNQALTVDQGTVPDVGGAMIDWFQSMQFQIVTKETIDFQVVETEEPVNFRGVIQPFTLRQLYLRPEGERAWTWAMVHAEPVLSLKVDDIISYRGVHFRVMGKKNYTIYNYVQYSLVQDFTGSGPEVKNVLSFSLLPYGLTMPGA